MICNDEYVCMYDTHLIYNTVVLFILSYICTVFNVHRICCLFSRLENNVKAENWSICTSLIYSIGLTLNKIAPPILTWCQQPAVGMKVQYEILQPKPFFLGKNPLRLHLKRFSWLELTLAAPGKWAKGRKFACVSSHSSLPFLPQAVVRGYGSRPFSADLWLKGYLVWIVTRFGTHFYSN
jgi:hypothetical protein